ncbi:MAG: DUF370 domain-containing protein [Clostridiaceae bacterium]|nr:DUF370 domain-containing protein [Clostridiaceae bacterium]
MYLHLGDEVMAKNRQIIGVFDLDTSTVTKTTRDFLAEAQKKGIVVNIGENLPKSFVLCEENEKFKVYISPLAASTLRRRAQSNKLFE